jgi:hypothetical protein
MYNYIDKIYDPNASSIIGLGLAKLIVNQSHRIVINYCNKLSINNFIFVL